MKSAKHNRFPRIFTTYQVFLAQIGLSIFSFLQVGCSENLTVDSGELQTDEIIKADLNVSLINPEEVHLEEVNIEEVAFDFTNVEFQNLSEIVVNEDGIHFTNGGSDLYDGGIISFYKSGQLSLRYVVESGLKNGPYEKYFENGNLNRRSVYKDGKLHGRFYKWFASGRRANEGQYLNGQEVGTFTWWYENGFRSEQGGYNRGKEHGAWMYYSEFGTVLNKIIFYEGDELLVEDGY